MKLGKCYSIWAHPEIIPDTNYTPETTRNAELLLDGTEISPVSWHLNVKATDLRTEMQSVWENIGPVSVLRLGRQTDDFSQTVNFGEA